MQKSRECWGPDVNEFVPDRWMDGEIASRYKQMLVVSDDVCSKNFSMADVTIVRYGLQQMPR